MSQPRVALVTLGCARNEADSEELAGRLEHAGFEMVADESLADAVLVNTCGFIDAAKAESISELLTRSDGTAGEAPERPAPTGPPSTGPAPTGPPVIAVGCLAQRYGRDLAESLPEVRAVVGFDRYHSIGDVVGDVLAGRSVAPHERHDRRELLPIAPVSRPSARSSHADPGTGHRSAPWLRQRLGRGPVAPLKIATGCDRRCSFCAIPSFRGRFVSRPIQEIVEEAAWLVDKDVRELLLVSENSTSYGKDLSGQHLPDLLRRLDALPQVARIRLSYLQPAELRPEVVSEMLALERVCDYFDLSFQHASPALLRRMRRFGGSEQFLELISGVRGRSPEAGFRSNVIVGFPGETEDDLAQLLQFLGEAQLDAVGVFGYSDEEGTEAAGLPGHLDDAEIRSRVSEVASVVDELMAQRAQARIGQLVEVLVEEVRGPVVAGRAAHQGPEDAETRVLDVPTARVGEIVPATVLATDGVDLIARWGGDVRH